MDLYAVTTQEVLDRISRHCPEALSTYLQCLNRSDANRKVFFSKKIVVEDLSETWTRFKNNVRKLALENLMEWHRIDEGILVILAETDE